MVILIVTKTKRRRMTTTKRRKRMMKKKQRRRREKREEQIGEDEREGLFDVIDGRHARQKKVAIGATIFADEKEIRSGSLDILVERLVADKPPETYLPVFFTTYRTFTTPKILLGMLLSLYHRAERDHKRFVASSHVPSSSSHSSSALSSGTIASISQEKRRSSRNGEKSDTRLQFRICNVLRMWMNEYFEDMLRSGGLLHYLICFIKGKLIPDKRDTLANILKTCLYNLINRTGNTSKVGRRKNSNNASERSDTTSAPTTPPPKPKIKSVDITSPRLSFCDIGEEEIARQLTLIEFEIFSRVKTYEFISPKNQPTVQEHIAFSNKVSLWAIATILEEEDAKGRAKMKARFITIASHLKHLSNYNGMISIVGALQSSALARLYDTNDELKKKRWSSAIKEQKELLAVAEAAKDICHQMLCNPAPPAIPPIAMVVSTISRLNSFHSDNFEGLINFAKRQLYCEVLFPLREYQKVPFNLCPVPQIHQLLSRQINLCRSEKQLHSLSQEREAFYESPLLSIKSEDCNLFSK
ncbi:RasGEF domain containing protein [Balamuthia mandrillaris]